MGKTIGAPRNNSGIITKLSMKASWKLGLSARRVARQLDRSDSVVRSVGTSESERCHLHEDQAQDALDRPVVEKTVTSK
ncbi:hypothetical protein TNCV_681571 [Trichonephila clavipes]|nr:hypothetical protein TNCV_681571 [Trichonephila clavipes]